MTDQRPDDRNQPILDSGIPESSVEDRRYASYVTECADALMQWGTDRYGGEHHPFLVTILDVESRECPPDPPRQYPYWRGQQRDCFWKPRGADLLVDQSTLEILDVLSGITGEARYAAFAERYARAAMSLVDDKGMFWWGWHRFYDVFDDRMSGSHGNHHEIHVNRPRWQYLWDLEPDAVRREIEGIWQWHVIDKETGEHNRHADAKRGCDFAMSGGEFVYALSFLYEKTRDTSWLEAAQRVADYHWRARDPHTDLTPNRPNAGADRFDGWHFDTSITGILGYYLLKSYELTGHDAFLEQAMAYLRAYGRYGYDAASGKFWGSLRLGGTPEPDPRIREGYGASEPRGHIDLWQPYQLGYEFPIYTAQVYAYAHALSGDDEMLQVANRWADWICRQPPLTGSRMTPFYENYARRYSMAGTYADYYGRTISLFVHLFALTGDEARLDTARRFAREAVSRLYYRGLFRGHPAKPYYSSVDGVGYLLYALLQLDQILAVGKAAVGKACLPLRDGAGALAYDNW